MSDNPMKDYVDNFRANLPSGVTFESVTARYFFNGKRFISEWDVERYREYIQKFGFSVSQIEAVVSPNLGTLVDGETIASAMSADYDQASNYTSSGGTIDTVVASATVNGSPALFTDTVSFNDVVSVSVVVTDSALNERDFNAGLRSVQGIAPTLTASDSLSGRTLTITVDSTTGTPTPTTALTTLTLDGSPVSPTTTGVGVWTYEVPDSVSSQTVAWTITATNAEDTATASGSEAVAANLFDPTAAGALADQTFTNDTGVQTFDASTDFSGTAPITYSLTTTTTGVTINSSTGVVSFDTDAMAVQASTSIIVRGTNTYGDDDSGFSVTISDVAGDADADDYISRVEAEDTIALGFSSPLEAGVKTAINTFFVGLKSDGNFAALKACCILAGARTLRGSLEPLVSTMPTPTQRNFPSGAYNREDGLNGDGVNRYLETNRLFSDDNRLDVHMSVYLTTTPVGGAARYISGGFNSQRELLQSTDATGARTRFGGSTLYTIANGTDNTPTFIGASRDNSSSFSWRAHGTSGTETETDGVATGAEYYVFAQNDGGTAITETDATIAFYSIGEAVDLALLEARVTQLMADIAIGIGGSEPQQTITATVEPVLLALTEGDTVQSAYTAGSYTSSAGTISSAVETVTINGSTGALGDVVSVGDEVLISVLVTDSASNTETFTTVTRTVQADTTNPPVASGSLEDQNLFIGQSVTVDVSADFVGDEPITYSFAPSYSEVLGLSLTEAGSLTVAPTEVVTNRFVEIRAENSTGADETSLQLTSAAGAITAASVPTLLAIESGNSETVEDGLSAGAMDPLNYNSSAGTVQTPTATITIDGSPGALTDTPSAGAVVSGIIRVEDDAGSVRDFRVGPITVVDVIPTVLSVPQIVGVPLRGATIEIVLGQYSDNDYTETGTLTQGTAPVFEGPFVDGDTSIQYTIPFGTEIGKLIEWTETSVYGLQQQVSVNVVLADPEIVPDFTIVWDGVDSFITSDAILSLEVE